MPSRELTELELCAAGDVCDLRNTKDKSHTLRRNGCPTCRADIVALVDGTPEGFTKSDFVGALSRVSRLAAPASILADAAGTQPLPPIEEWHRSGIEVTEGVLRHQPPRLPWAQDERVKAAREALLDGFGCPSPEDSDGNPTWCGGCANLADALCDAVAGCYTQPEKRDA